MRELKPPQYIETDSALAHWAAHCQGCDRLAVDTEADSFHHYKEKVCLIQMTAGGEDAILDPLRLTNIASLAPLFADADRIKIFHDAGYDLIGLRRDFGFEVRGIFDTMLAARLLGHQSFGLAAMLAARFGHETDKRLQRSDWARRPLSAEQLAYARFDTHFLPQLADHLHADLAAAGRLTWAHEEFARLPALAARTPGVRRTDPDGFWRLPGVKHLSPQGRGRLKALYMKREQLAEQIDRPPFKVLGDQVLLDLARDPPHSLRELTPRPGLRHAGIERFGRQIIDALRSATPVHDGPPPGVKRRRRSGRFVDPDLKARYEALRAARKAKAVELGIDPEVVLSNAVLEDLARTPPQHTDDLGRYP
ncbi:MAG: ribonuclease D, partial [Deltaproteobacteria bacterium]|nr:ribonuclease D [Deltaproteobacteria bacterium]